MDAKVLHAGSYKAAWIAELFDGLKQWCDAGARDAPFEHAKLPQLTRELKLRYGTREVTLEYREGDLLNRLS